MAKKDELVKERLEEAEAFNDQADEIRDAEPLEEVDELHEDIEEEARFKGEDEIYPGGPTYDKLQDWKSRFDGEVYMSDFNDTIFIWRPIRRKEYKEIQNIENINEYYMEEQICQRCMLWPEDYAMQKMTFGKAGIPTTLSQLIMERSGFLRPETIKL